MNVFINKCNCISVNHFILFGLVFFSLIIMFPLAYSTHELSEKRDVNTKFLPDDYEWNSKALNGIVIFNGILISDDKLYTLVIWDLTDITIDESFWYGRGNPTNIFEPLATNCIEWSPDHPKYKGVAYSCIFNDAYEIYIRNNSEGEKSYSGPFNIMMEILEKISTYDQENRSVNHNSLDVSKIPNWIKNVFSWYAQDEISEDEVLNAIKFLVNEGIIILDD